MKVFKLLVLLSVYSYSQTESSIVCKTVDEFSDKVSYDSGNVIMYEDGGDMKTEGMVAMLFSESEEKKKGYVGFNFLLKSNRYRRLCR